MKIANLNKWVEYLSRLSRQPLKKKIANGRKREAGRKDWSLQRKQSLADPLPKRIVQSPDRSRGNFWKLFT